MKTLILSAVLFGSLLPSRLDTPAVSAPAAVSWSQPFAGSWTWSPASQHAAGLVEAGFSDWRLPTRAECQAAIQGGTLPALTSGSFYYWTSEKQGNRAWAVKITADANGVVIPAQSGTATKLLQTSFVQAIATRP